MELRLKGAPYQRLPIQCVIHNPPKPGQTCMTIYDSGRRLSDSGYNCFSKKSYKKLSFWLFAFSHILAPLSIKFSSVIMITSLFGQTPLIGRAPCQKQTTTYSFFYEHDLFPLTLAVSSCFHIVELFLERQDVHKLMLFEEQCAESYLQQKDTLFHATPEERVRVIGFR